MKNVIVIIWALILGQLLGYIGAAVTSLSYSVGTMAIISAIFGVIVCVLPQVMKTKKASSH